MIILLYWCFQKKKHLSKNVLRCKRKKAHVIFEMKEVNRQVVMCVLDKIEKDGTKKFLPYLEAWKMLEVKKVAARIIEVENEIAGKGM